MFKWGLQHTLHFKIQWNMFELGFPVQTGDQVDYFIEYSWQRRKHALKAVFANTDYTSGTVGAGECSTSLLKYLDRRVIEFVWGLQHTLHLKMQRTKLELGFPVLTGDRVISLSVLQLTSHGESTRSSVATAEYSSGATCVAS